MDQLSIIQDVFAKRVFQVPDYQRGYAWQEQQLEDFVQDLELLAEGKQHFFGTLILHTGEDRPKARDEHRKTYLVCDIVDGQQRLTTVVLLLDAIRQEMTCIGS